MEGGDEMPQTTGTATQEQLEKMHMEDKEDMMHQSLSENEELPEEELNDDDDLELVPKMPLETDIKSKKENITKDKMEEDKMSIDGNDIQISDDNILEKSDLLNYNYVEINQNDIAEELNEEITNIEANELINEKTNEQQDINEVVEEINETGQEIWQQCEAMTSSLAIELTEHLRLILEPTMASKLAGDYKTGLFF